MKVTPVVAAVFGAAWSTAVMAQAMSGDAGSHRAGSAAGIRADLPVVETKATGATFGLPTAAGKSAQSDVGSGQGSVRHNLHPGPLPADLNWLAGGGG